MTATTDEFNKKLTEGNRSIVSIDMHNQSSQARYVSAVDTAVESLDEDGRNEGIGLLIFLGHTALDSM